MRALVLVALPGCFIAHDSHHCPSDPVLGSQADVAAFTGCTRAHGIAIRTGAAIDVTPLRDLEVIDGELVIGPTLGVDEVAFNGLRTAGAIRVVDNSSLGGLFLPRLERAERVVVDHNVSMKTIAMPRVQELPGALVITDNHDLQLVDAPSLVTVGELVISGESELELVELGKLAHAGSVRLEADPKLSPELVEQLHAKAAAP